MMCLEIMGPPGAGKGTQARKLASARGILHVSTGDMFRENIRQRTDLGKKAGEYLQNGGLVPDDVVTLMVAMIKLGAVASLDAGPAAPFFAGVVVLTMLAAESFDPRLIWDYMEDTDGEP